jgi:hypothetical protein
MEPISAIAISLALGAGATAGKEVVSALVKDAYGKLKELVRSRYPKVSVDHLEQAPESKARLARSSPSCARSRSTTPHRASGSASATIRARPSPPRRQSALDLTKPDIAAAIAKRPVSAESNNLTFS